MLETIIGWTITVPCALLGIGASSFNLWWLWWRVVRRKQSVSQVPVVGVCAALVCAAVCPERSLIWVWIAMAGVETSIVLHEACGAAWDWWYDAR